MQRGRCHVLSVSKMLLCRNLPTRIPDPERTRCLQWDCHAPSKQAAGLAVPGMEILVCDPVTRLYMSMTRVYMSWLPKNVYTMAHVCLCLYLCDSLPLCLSIQLAFCICGSSFLVVPPLALAVVRQNSAMAPWAVILHGSSESSHRGPESPGAVSATCTPFMLHVPLSWQVCRRMCSNDILASRTRGSNI